MIRVKSAFKPGVTRSFLNDLCMPGFKKRSPPESNHTPWQGRSCKKEIMTEAMSMVQSTLLLGISGVLLSPSKKAAKND